jgi:hypothetical protein
MREKIQDVIKKGVLVETPKHLICWCNRYRLVPKANGDMRLVVGQSIYGSKTLQN